MITGEQLKKICKSITLQRANELAILISKSCPKYGIDTPIRLQAFVSQIAHESGEFTIKTENMNYTTPSRIVAIWSSRFNLDGSGGKLNANDYAKNPQKLANTVYANRMGNGDFASGDGFRYRGGGYLQLTGKESYQAYAKYIGKEVGETADLVRSTEEYALDSACWEYAIDKKLNGMADKRDFVTITKRINGGTIGLAEREKYYKLSQDNLA
jgi:putative chitinase